MKHIFLVTLLIVLIHLFGCNHVNNINNEYIGTFITESGVKFELRPDSTATIYFDDTLKYDVIWRPQIAKDSLKYANIEFAGYTTYYYLRNGKLYRSSMQMRNDYCGEKVTYKD